MNYWGFIKTHKYGVSVFLILLLAFILRFYNYENRWGLAYDQARDVLVAREALRSFSLPLIGPFASAGQFVYGPQWFWILIVMVSVYPYSVITPWVILTVLYVGVVWLMIVIGRDIYNRKFGLVLGILTAISTAQLSHATNLTSPSMVGIFSIASIYFFVRYIKTGFVKNAFWMAIMIDISINIHFQSIGLLVLIPISFLLDRNRSFKKLFYLLGGIVIPFIPLIFFDITNNFFESKNWVEYIRHGQYTIYVPNRWLTYAGVYWPNSWAKIIGGELLLGYIIPVFFAIFTVIAVVRRKFSRIIFLLVLSFGFIFLMLRYYRGERIDSNIVFLHPFILIFTGWVILTTLKLNRIAGLILLSAILIFTLRTDLSLIKNSENLTAIQMKEWGTILMNKFPDKKFAIYDYQYKHVHKSLPVVLFLESQRRIDGKGLKVGIYIATSKTDFRYSGIIGGSGEYQFLNLDATSSAHLSKEEWAPVNPSQVYKSTVQWYKKDKP
ncbi:MAG: hypothetical protein HYW62_02005 [Candidatus Levybacteria bacterium]|nr:hypothetical protein [Candidatus Levybacteria bacterium]